MFGSAVLLEEVLGVFVVDTSDSCGFQDIDTLLVKLVAFLIWL